MDEDCRKRDCGFKGVGLMDTETVAVAVAVRGWETQSCFSEATEYSTLCVCVALCWVGDKSQLLKGSGLLQVPI